MASKKSTCDSVRRKIAGKTREEIMDAISAEFNLPRSKCRAERSKKVAKPTPAGTPKKVKS